MTRRSFLLVFFLMIGFFAGACFKLLPSKSVLLYPQVKPVFSGKMVDVATPTPVAMTGLQKVVAGALVGTTGEYSIAIKNLKTGESYYQNEHKKYPSASLYKLWVMTEVYNEVKMGKIKLEDKIDSDADSLNAEFGIASGSAEMTGESFHFTVAQALEQMITISHNYAALTLISKLKTKNITATMKASGLVESSLGDPPTTTAVDTAKFLEKLYKGELLGGVYRQDMIDLLSRQKLNEGLPKYLPAQTLVAHKTGEIDLYKHNAGLIFTPQTDYVIVVLSQSDVPKAAQERIAKVSKAVYDYFVK